MVSSGCNASGRSGSERPKGVRNPTAVNLIAPCGMNCGICSAYLREKNMCPGCRGIDIDKSVTRVRCKIKNCDNIKIEKAKFCNKCEEFPCANLRYLDKRYRTRYEMSMIENLENISKFGIRKFIVNEKTRWSCPKCDGTINVHKGICNNCGAKKM
jgi:hypothetical protein